MRRRCPDARGAGPAQLEGWRLAFRGVADIERAAGRRVHGALWSLSDRDLANLDRYEGAPDHYRRELVEITTPDGPCLAITYVMTDRSYLGLPSPLYVERMATGFRDWGLSVRQLARAIRETRLELERLGVERYEIDGEKRLRALLEEA